MLNKAPTKYELHDLIEYVKNGDCCSSFDGETWVPARPIGFFSLKKRFKYAWMVFTGKVDIVTWPGGQ